MREIEHMCFWRKKVGTQASPIQCINKLTKKYWNDGRLPLGGTSYQTFGGTKENTKCHSRDLGAGMNESRFFREVDIEGGARWNERISGAEGEK